MLTRPRISYLGMLPYTMIIGGFYSTVMNYDDLVNSDNTSMLRDGKKYDKH